MAVAADPPSAPQPPPSPVYSATPFPYPTVFYLNPQNAIHLDLRGVRFKVDLAILRLFPESILLTMFGQSGQFPILALLQGAGRDAGMAALVQSQSGGILVNGSSSTSHASPFSPTSSDPSTDMSSSSASFSTSANPGGLVRKPSYVPPMTRNTALRWQKFYDAEADMAAAKAEQKADLPPSVPEEEIPADSPSEKRVTIADAPVDLSRHKKHKIKVRRNPSGFPRNNADDKAGGDAEGVAGSEEAPILPDDADADDDSSSVEEVDPSSAASADAGSTTSSPAPPFRSTMAEHRPLVVDETASTGPLPPQHPFSPTPPSDLPLATAPIFTDPLDDPSTSDPSTPHLPISFDPRLFGFILEFFQVVLHSLYQPRIPGIIDSHGGGIMLPSGGEVTRLLEGVVSGGVGVGLKAPLGPQMVIVLREELDYFVIPAWAMDKNEVRDEGEYSGNDAVGAGGEDTVNIDDPLAHLPPRRLLLLALIKRGVGRWLLARKKVLEGREKEFLGRAGISVIDPHPDAPPPPPVAADGTQTVPQHKPILDTLAIATELDGMAEWGYRELEMGKCRMVSLTMLRVKTPRQDGGGIGVGGAEGKDTAPSAPASGATVSAAEVNVPSVITQVSQGGGISGDVGGGGAGAARRPQRKCWWEAREVRCTLPEGLLDEVERRAAFVAIGEGNHGQVEPAGDAEKGGVGGMATTGGVGDGEGQVRDDADGMPPLDLDILVEENESSASGAPALARESSAVLDTTVGKGKSVVGGGITPSGDSVHITQQLDESGEVPAARGVEHHTKGRDPALWWNRREQAVKVWVRRIWTLEYCTV
ncbi:hypothetical protein HDU93_007912 [Gonapodya sp. JEL0774]|nr:hypothetical protein HDU93_007912 [Gonapodya sp. JEL0774]